MSWRVKGRVVDEWVTESLTPVEGEEVDIIVEGWCAVLSEVSVPMLLGGDIVR
jgi:ABC-type tungstate transport system substrate-binding protein